MPPKSKLDPHLTEIKADAVRGSTRAALAVKYNVTGPTMGSFLKSRQITLLPPAAARVTLPEPDAPVDRAEMLEHENRELRSRLTKVRKTDVQYERVLEEIKLAVRSEPPRYTPRSSYPDGKGAQHTQALLLSDLHGGEIINAEAMNGLNEFNWDILTERMGRIHKSLLSFQAARPYPIDELQIWMLGDMCSGSNHQELAETNEFSAADQGFKVGMLLAQFVEELVPHYPRIKIHGVAGNHPRVHQKPMSKQVFNNFDWVAYMIVEQKLAQYASVSTNFPRAGSVIAEIAGQKGYLFHGDGIRSSMPGVPWGGVMRRFNEIRKNFAEAGIYLDFAALGHFHQACVVPGIFMNGSVKGDDEYGTKNFGGGQRPTQLLLTFDEGKQRLTDTSYITP